jgi:hypothetical protein
VANVRLAGERGKRLAQVLEDAAVINDKPVVLAFIHPIRARLLA